MSLITTNCRTMPSTQLRDLINDAREQAGEPRIRNDQLIAKIEDELEGELGVCRKIAHPQSGALMDCYDLNRDQCLLVGMRESKAVRRRVAEKLNELEQMAQRPMTQAELIAASANQLVAIERQQAAHQVALERVEDRTTRLEQVRYLDSVPSGFETITTIRDRINRRHGLPAWVVNLVMREVTRAPLPYAFVRSRHADEGGQPFAIWPKPAVTQRFDRFVTECTYETAERATHPEIPQGRFKIARRFE
ncbi:phage antirepressor [Pseudomonas putida]|uniref:phage antirepressor n=1 Tax=Pseudomonas putida TaxID=303 RepID=UPI0018E66CD2|nr:phage antirepressor [Pseudomonas putida]MBI6925690.1 phage antirepressor [Pseudomonas putida]